MSGPLGYLLFLWKKTVNRYAICSFYYLYDMLAKRNGKLVWDLILHNSLVTNNYHSTAVLVRYLDDICEATVL